MGDDATQEEYEKRGVREAKAAEAKSEEKSGTNMEEGISCEENDRWIVLGVKEDCKHDFNGSKAKSKEDEEGEGETLFTKAAPGLEEEEESHRFLDYSCDHEKDKARAQDIGLLAKEDQEENLRQESGTASQEAVEEKCRKEHVNTFKV